MSRLTAWIMWGLASAFYAYQYILRVLPNIMMPDIMAKYNIEAGLFGQFSGLYYIGYAGMHIPIGLLLDRVGPKKVLPICMLLAVAGLSPLYWTDIWSYPIIGRALIGIGSSGAILGVFKIIQMCFPTDRFTRMLGISVTIGLMGAMYGGTPVYYLLQTFGWEKVILLICSAGVFMAAASYLLLPTYHNHTPAEENIWQTIKIVMTHPRAMMICILGGMMVGPLEGFADVWGTEYLKTAYEIDPEIAAGLPSFIYLGMCVGAPLLSYIAEKTSYYGVIITSAIGMGTSFVLILSGILDSWSLSAFFFLIGVLCAYQIPVIFMASQVVPQHVASLTTACANMIIMTFGYIFHTTIGQVLSTAWDGTLHAGSPVYSINAYNTALSIVPLGLILAAIGFSIIARRSRVMICNT